MCQGMLGMKRVGSLTHTMSCIALSMHHLRHLDLYHDLYLDHDQGQVMNTWGRCKKKFFFQFFLCLFIIDFCLLYCPVVQFWTSLVHIHHVGPSVTLCTRTELGNLCIFWIHLNIKTHCCFIRVFGRTLFIRVYSWSWIRQSWTHDIVIYANTGYLWIQLYAYAYVCIPIIEDTVAVPGYAYNCNWCWVRVPGMHTGTG
jgi:hypothetical protein